MSGLIKRLKEERIQGSSAVLNYSNFDYWVNWDDIVDIVEDHDQPQFNENQYQFGQLGSRNLGNRRSRMVPNSIKVAGMTYKVEEVPFVEIDGDRNFQGVCLFHENTIQVLETLSEDRKEQTFVHELTHAIFYEAGFEEQDEDMINRVSLVLHQVLKDRHLEVK